jgi:hypothetical protein
MPGITRGIEGRGTHMTPDMVAALGNVLIVGLMLLGLVSPIVVFVVLLWISRRHLAGRHSRFDGLFGGIGRSGAMYSHLNAGTPDPDDLAVPLPPRPGRPPRDL